MRSILWILPFFITSGIYAQQNFASISFGTSIPLGAYAKTGDLSSNGYASPGGAIKFDAGYFPVSYLGIGGSFAFGSNYALRDSMLSDMFRYLETHAQSPLVIPQDAEVLYGTGFWNYISLFMGPHFSLRPSRRLYLDLRAMAGVSILRPPGQDLRVSFDETEIFSRVSTNSIAFGFTAGGGMRFKLNDALAIKLGVDYFRSRSRFDFNFDLSRGMLEEIPDLASDLLIETLELSAGLAYSF
ncbi:MAG TPA: hypothetical protein ENO20_14670 [Bacteroides sp.]|nr:hypothetical protein [Bacteroides sp.]